MQDTTFENDKGACLRFSAAMHARTSHPNPTTDRCARRLPVGWLQRAHAEVELSLVLVFGSVNLGTWAEEFCSFLGERSCKHSTMA